jgi:hypothetical protein
MCGDVRCMFPYPFTTRSQTCAYITRVAVNAPGVTSVLHELRDLAKVTRKSSAKTYTCQSIIKFYGIMFDICSLIIVPCKLKHAEILSVLIQYKHAKKNTVQLVG